MTETSRSTAIVGGRVVPVEGEPIEGGTVLLRDGKIAAVEGPGFTAPSGTEIVDATGKWVLPGFIDAHAHAGARKPKAGRARTPTSGPTRTPRTSARWTRSTRPTWASATPSWGGLLAVNVNPGSANPIGGQTVAIKCWGRTVDEMVLRQAGLKSALGENPKRVYGERNVTLLRGWAPRR